MATKEVEQIQSVNPKYHIGETVFLIHDNKIIQSKISLIVVIKGQIKYSFTEYTEDEYRLYATNFKFEHEIWSSREALIEHIRKGGEDAR